MLPRYLLVIISGITAILVAGLIVVCILAKNKWLLFKLCESNRPTSNCRTVPSWLEVSAPVANTEELIPLWHIDIQDSIPDTLPPPPPLTSVATLKQIASTPNGPTSDHSAPPASPSGSFADSLQDSSVSSLDYSRDPRRSPITPIISDNIARALHDLTS